MNYIFGYGSLICKDSRSRTGVSGDAFPVEVKGIERRWSLHTPDWPATALGAHKHPTARCNGIYFPVDDENLTRFDEREQGYSRIAIDWQDVVATSSKEKPSSGTLWVYVGHSSKQPNKHKPIMQSYLDVILNGCLDYGEPFAKRFTQTTLLWQHLVNDRSQPAYLRPLKSTARLNDIDAIIQQQLPELLKKRTNL